MTVIEYLRAYLPVTGFVPSALLTALCGVALLGTRSTKWGLAIVALPGTLMHELSHFLVGMLLGAKPSNFSLWPKDSGKHWTLGSVSFRRVNVFNGAFVALAPLLLFPLGWLCLIYMAMPAWAADRWATWVLANYLTANLFYAGLPSIDDLKLGAMSMAIYLTVIAGGWWTLSVVN